MVCNSQAGKFLLSSKPTVLFQKPQNKYFCDIKIIAAITKF